MWKIVFYIDHRGQCPPKEFIASLPAMDRAKIQNGFKLLREFGVHLNMPHVKQIQGKLWELRPGGIRLFYFVFIENQIVI